MQPTSATTVTAFQTTAPRHDAALEDYVALLKPRVMWLAIFTAVVGMVVAPGTLHPVLMTVALLAIAIGAGASGALNMWYDADIDAGMARTARRPVARGRVSADEALTLGVVLSVISVAMLGLAANWAAAALLALTIAFYLFVYTMWLKRRTPHNIVIGGAAGAFPPMIGWAAQTGSVTLESVILFAIIFMWTPPHFWALSLYRRRDYQNVGVPMLPVVAGTAETRRQILLYAVLLAPVAIAPYALGFAGALYGIVATLLSAWFVWLALATYRSTDGHKGDAAARRLFRFSLYYLFVIFATLLLERLSWPQGGFFG